MAAGALDETRGRTVVALAGRSAGARREGFDLTAAFDEHAGALLGFAVNTLGERQLAEDCVQETFLRAWRARATFDPEQASLRTWLFAIERNILKDALRTRSRTPTLAGEEQLDDIAATGQTDPVERMRIVEAMALLSDAHREVVVAVHVRGHTYAEVAESTGVPAATLRTRAFHALRALRKRLDEDGGPR
jgi:RNA polymerase sigma-70 factor, ECF subfamily